MFIILIGCIHEVYIEYIQVIPNFMNDSLFTNIITNFWCALLALIVVTGVFHLLLVFPKNLSKREWKKIDYYWISLTAVGLIGSTRVAEKTISQNNSYNYEYIMSFNAEQLLYHLTTENSSWVCRTFIKNKYSPDNLQELQKKYDDACKWRSEVAKIVMAAIESEKLQAIETNKIPKLEEGDEQIKTFKKIVIDYITVYNNAEKMIRRNSEIQEQTTAEMFLSYFSPILLIFGLALRITKVSGELKYEKKNEV